MVAGSNPAQGAIYRIQKIQQSPKTPANQPELSQMVASFGIVVIAIMQKLVDHK
jgi:hypothetical protein